ncbi:MAG: DUF1622 domain-containing protein [Marinovum algicola]|uniref:DUF1622 domain-containing protein n=1 Tax=Marinovum TaxID=367771 RepID=UPI001FCDB984|nr:MULTISPECIES: DUF1622 domain-containing protein [Marinovum]MDD9738628.1 DUF1622 domain-containing protein [Marinovum sp. SP66]MDD9744456.1 DUF1622 domain-containing protein [Marinovum sp. PR37]
MILGSLVDLELEGGILHGQFSWLVELLEWAAAIVDIAAVVLILLGAVRFIIGVSGAEIFGRGSERVNRTNRERIELGRYILASLELFIVSDIIHTALSLAFSDLMFLGLLVVIRSITSFFLDRELEQLKKDLGE